MALLSLCSQADKVQISQENQAHSVLPIEAIPPKDKLQPNSSFLLWLCCQNNPQAGLGKGEVVGQGQLEPTAVEGFGVDLFFPLLIALDYKYGKTTCYQTQ